MSSISRYASGLAAAFLTLQFLACASDSASTASSTPTSSQTAPATSSSTSTSQGVTVTTAEVGAEGGTFATESGMTVTVPAGALPANTTITVTSGAESAPTGYLSDTGVFRFGPDGLVFATPITVSLPSSASTGAVYWSRQDDPNAYDALPTTFEDGHAIAHPVHFSSAFVGKAVETRTDPAGQPDAKDAGTSTEPGTPDAKDAGTPTDTRDAGEPIDTKDAGTPTETKDAGTPTDTRDAGETKEPGTPPPPQPMKCTVAYRTMSKECPNKGCLCELPSKDETGLFAQFDQWFGDPQGAIYVSSETLNSLYQTAASGGTFVATDDTHTRYAAPRGYGGYLVRNGDSVELHEDYALAAKDTDGCGGVPQMTVICSGTGTIQRTGEDR